MERGKSAYPFGTLVIVVPVSHGLIAGLVGIVVVRAVAPVVGIKRGHSQGSKKLFTSYLKSVPSVLRIEQLGSYRHCYGEIASQLVVRPRMATVQGVLVHPGLVDEVRPLVDGIVLLDVEVLFEVGLDLVSPFLEGPLRDLAILVLFYHRSVLVMSLRVHH